MTSSTQSEICVADAAVPDAAAVCLTDDVVMSNRDPAVSPDGSTVTWSRCEPDGTGCDVYVVQRARRRGVGDRRPAHRLDRARTSSPTPTGEIVTYASNAAGDYDIWWEDVDGTDEHSARPHRRAGQHRDQPERSPVVPSASSGRRPADLNADLYVVRPEQGDPVPA